MNYPINYTYHSPFNNFIRSIAVWEQINSPPYKTEVLKSFLDSLIISGKHLENLPTIEEIKQKKLNNSKKFNVNKKGKPRKKWTYEEKEILIWAVYYFMQIYRKTLNIMVVFPSKMKF